jgi:hypothetical protein
MSDDVVTNVWSGAKSEGEAADPSAVKDGALAFSEGVVIGLDLGTSNSCAAVWHLDKGITKVNGASIRRGLRPWISNLG